MSYTDDAAKAKLSSLNETQESIVTVAQWVMFHKRFADRTGQLWLQRLKDSTPSKRLNLIYLANEVVQQSKARKKDEFLLAFTPIIVEASVVTAKGANSDVLQKLRRVVEIWRQRAVFDQATQDTIEVRLEEIDRTSARNPTKKPLLGGSLFSAYNSVIPTELHNIVSLQHAVSKAFLGMTPLTSKAEMDFAALSDAAQPAPSLPALAAQLNALIKTLASAEEAVSESLKARRGLIEEMEKILESNRSQLTIEENDHSELTVRKTATIARRHEVEDQIMRALPAENGHSASNHDADLNILQSISNIKHQQHDEPRPEVERFTPPPVESMTPPDMPANHIDGTEDSDRPHYEELTPPPAAAPSTPPSHTIDTAPSLAPLPNNSADPRRRATAGNKRPGSNSPVNGNIGAKRRKASGQEGDYLGFVEGADAMEGLDAEVVGMLG